MLLPDLTDALATNNERSTGPARVRVLTSDYLDVTDPEALRLLLLLQEKGAEVRVYETEGSSFHLKAYIFTRVDADDRSRERHSSAPATSAVRRCRMGWSGTTASSTPATRDSWRRDGDSTSFSNTAERIRLSDSWIESYEAAACPPLVQSHPAARNRSRPEPHSCTGRGIGRALPATRDRGFRRGLVVLATGLGKTWLAAFDFARMGAAACFS